MCGTFCHFAKPSRGNNVAPFVLSVFESEFAGILLVALATFVVYTNVRMSVQRPILALRNHMANTRWNSARPLPWSLVSVEGQNPSQLFATVETLEAIEWVKSSMFM